MRTMVRKPTEVVLALLLLFGVGTQAADYTVTVNGGQNKSLTAFMQGFLHGSYPAEIFDATLVGTNLQPEFWRLGFGGWDRYPNVAALGSKVTMVISDQYVDYKGGAANAKPWLNWTEWEQYCAAQVSYSISQSKPVDYWDIWNEPDTATWSGTWAQLLETYKRCYNAIKSVDANAKVVGPGTTEWDSAFLTDNTKDIFDFVYELAHSPYNVRLEAVAWHEIGSQPAWMPAHAQALRDFFTNTTYFNPAYTPELHVPEYDQPNNSQIPGWLVGWLYYAEQANIDWLSRACWNTWEGDSNVWLAHPWSNCLQGLNGLFMRDLRTPQQPYYVYKTYAEVAAGTRVVTSSTDNEVNALASKDDTRSMVKVMVGMHNKLASGSVDITFTNFPYSSTGADVTVRKLTNNNVLNASQDPKAQPGVYPTVTYAGNVGISGGSFTINIASFADGEMYVIEAVPATSAVPGAASAPSPAASATGVSNNADLSWTAGSGATSHDVYFGTTNPPPFKQNQSGTSYDPGALLGGTYYWRINEKNGFGTTTGTVWSFTTSSTSATVYQPDAVSVTQGTHSSGNLSSCLSDDNNFYVATGHIAPAVAFNFTLAEARAQVLQLRVKVRSKDNATLPLARHLALWNYDSGALEAVEASAIGSSESDLEITITSNAGRFVGADKTVKMIVQHVGSPNTHNMSVEYVQVGINGG